MGIPDRQRVAEFDRLAPRAYLSDEMRVSPPECIFAEVIQLGGFSHADLPIRCEIVRQFAKQWTLLRVRQPAKEITDRRGRISGML
jgi:hypothetical protein